MRREPQRILRFGEFILEAGEHRLTHGLQEIPLRPKTFQTLLHLVERAGHLVTKDEILDDVWSDVTVTESTLAHSVSELRQALSDECGQPRYIRTIPKLGYKFLAEVQEITPAPELVSQPGLPPSSGPSIAVLPFKDMSPEGDQQYFCEGIAEEIINVLTHLGEIRVVARTSAFLMQARGADIREIGATLNVGTVLEGSVRKAQGRLRITVQLISVADGVHLWSERFDHDQGNVFAVQDEISAKIAKKLKVEGLQRGKAIERRRTDDLEAFHLFLKGRYFFYRGSTEDMQRAVECFSQAIDRAPDYALPHAGLSICYSMMVAWNHTSPAAGFPKAKRAALEALDLGPDLPETHHALGLVQLLYDWDWPGAEVSFRHSVALDPDYEMVRDAYCVYFWVVGKLDGAIEQQEIAIALDPLSIIANCHLGISLARAGLFEQARERLRKTLDLEPGHATSLMVLGQAYVLESRHNEGIAEIEKAVACSGRSPQTLAALAWALGIAGRKAEVQAILQELKSGSQRKHVGPCLFAKVYCGLGEKDLAFEWLDRAYEEHDVWLPFVKSDETMTGLRGDRRFTRLLERLGLADQN